MLRAVVVVRVLGVPVAVWLVLRAGGWLWCSLPVVVLLVLRAILVVRVTCMPLVVQLVLQALEVLRCGGGGGFGLRFPPHLPQAFPPPWDAVHVTRGWHDRSQTCSRLGSTVSDVCIRQRWRPSVLTSPDQN